MSRALPILLFILMACSALAADTTARVLSIAGDTMMIRPESGVIYILAGNYSCSSCYREVAAAIRSIDTTIRIIGIIRPAANTPASRRAEVSRMKRLLGDVEYVFDMANAREDRLGSYSGGLFGDHDVSITPCVLLRSPTGTWAFLTHSHLYARAEEDGAVRSIATAIRRAMEKR